MPASLTIELHFREFFKGERVRVLAGGKTLLDLTPRTRPQIGLASVETITVPADAAVTIRVEGVPEKTLRIVNGVTVYLVDLRDKALTVEPARSNPTYM